MNEKNGKERNLNELRSCLEATETFKKAFDEYIKLLKKYNDDKESFKRWKSDWNDWKNRTGRYNVYKNHGVNLQFWANEHDGTCWWGENWNSAHKWCHDAANSKGHDGENYWAKRWGMCKGRFGNFLCGKPDEEVKKQNEEYTAAEPKTDPQNKTKYWLGMNEPTPPQALSGNNIMCCSQLFDDISVTGGGNANFSNIIQNCIQKISTKLKENPVENDNKPPKQYENETPNKTPYNNDVTNATVNENGNTIKTVIIITMMIIVCVSLMLSASVFAESVR